MNEEAEVREVLAALRSYVERVDELHATIAGRHSISMNEQEVLQAKLIVLKADIRDAAKRKKVFEYRVPQTAIERAYFEPAMRGASANFVLAADSHPITADWCSYLYDMNTDLIYFMFQLEKRLEPD